MGLNFSYGIEKFLAIYFGRKKPESRAEEK
jgi:hypothetical protein